MAAPDHPLDEGHRPRPILDRGRYHIRTGRSRIGQTSIEAGAMDFALTEQQELIRKEVAALARSFSAGVLAREGRQGRVSVGVRQGLRRRRAGSAMIIPEEYGGSGLGVTEAALMLHEICARRAPAPAAARRSTSTCFPPMPVIKHGTEAPEAEVPAAHRHRRDRHGVRRDRAERRHRHLAHPDPGRARRATASSSTAARCGTPTPRTPPTSCCSPARRRATRPSRSRG